MRSTDVRNALQKMPIDNEGFARKKLDNDDEWDKLDFGYDENDTYEYVYDPDYGKESEIPTEIGSLKG